MTISQSVMAKENTSALTSYSPCVMTSGAIHRYVPVSAVIFDPSRGTRRARPKSQIFASKDPEIKTFEALKSRCITPTSCKYVMPRVMPTATRIASTFRIGPFSRKYSSKGPFAMNSVTKHSSDPSTTEPTYPTRFACLRVRSILTSWKKSSCADLTSSRLSVTYFSATSM